MRIDAPYRTFQTELEIKFHFMHLACLETAFLLPIASFQRVSIQNTGSAPLSSTCILFAQEGVGCCQNKLRIYINPPASSKDF